MANKKLANNVRSRGSYFSRRRSQALAIRFFCFSIFWEGWHMWGIHGIPEVIYGSAGTYITIYLLDKDRICRLFQ